MFRSKTLFILGAGASHEVGLPVGETLKEQIADKIDIQFENGHTQKSGDPEILQALRNHALRLDGGWGNINLYTQRAHQLVKALPQAISIDNLLDGHRGDAAVELCGKLGIVKCILQAERNSKIYFDPTRHDTIQFRNAPINWFAGLVKVLTENVARTEAESIFDNVKFISFNYDRCLEHYLYNALGSYYALDSSQIAAVTRKLQVFHPYGQVGKLPWQASINSVPYGSEGSDILVLSKQIKTFFEKVQEEADMAEMKKAVEDAEVIVFLGFGFHRKNLELIDPGIPCKAKRVFATALGISKSDCDIVNREIVEMLRQEHKAAVVEIREGLKCSELFSEYWRSLTSSY